MPRLEFADFLARSLELLRLEAPEHHAELAVTLAGCGLRLEVDGAPLALRFEHGRHALGAPDGSEVVWLRTDVGTILDLIDAELELLAALAGERLWLQGSADAVTRFDEALTGYLDGAIRCPSFPALLAAFRRSPHVAAPEARTHEVPHAG